MPWPFFPPSPFSGLHRPPGRREIEKLVYCRRGLRFCRQSRCYLLTCQPPTPPECVWWWLLYPVGLDLPSAPQVCSLTWPQSHQPDWGPGEAVWTSHQPHTNTHTHTHTHTHSKQQGREPHCHPMFDQGVSALPTDPSKQVEIARTQHASNIWHLNCFLLLLYIVYFCVFFIIVQNSCRVSVCVVSYVFPLK